MHNWMGALFFRRADPIHIAELGYADLRYWFGWHEVMEEAEADAVKRMNNA